MKLRALAIALLSLELLAGSVYAAEYFNADFDGTTVTNFGGTISYGAQITEENLIAGTSIGTWTVNKAQAVPTLRTMRMIQTDGGGDVSTYDIKLAGNSIAGGSGIAFRDASSSKWTGSAFGNIIVFQIAPPSGTVLIIR